MTGTPLLPYRLAVPTQPDFRFAECHWYLDRGYDDCLYQLGPTSITRAVQLSGSEAPVILHLYPSDGQPLLHLETDAPPHLHTAASAYVADWLDTHRDLTPFYQLLQKDARLAPLAEQYRGLRLVGIPDLFEALCWAIIGQQINLTFAYALKRRLVEAYGTQVASPLGPLWLFPTPQQLLGATVEDLRAMKYSGRKAEYVLGLAQHFADTHTLDAHLRAAAPDDAFAQLVALRGIGEWTARYALMKCLRHPDSIPYGDAGLNQALHRLKDFPLPIQRPKAEKLFARYRGWQSYLVFYMWRSLS